MRLLMLCSEQFKPHHTLEALPTLVRHDLWFISELSQSHKASSATATNRAGSFVQ